MERTKVKLDVLIIFILASFVLLFNLGTGSLTSWDEAVYAGVSGEIIKSNNWFDLTWKGQPWSDKPPLYMWMTALFYKIFGINEFSARFFSCICGIGTVILIYFFAKKLYSRNIAVASSLLLISTQHFIWSAKAGMLDCAFTFFITLSLFLFKLGEEKNIYLFLCPLAFACAFLTKGVGALLIPAILAFYIIFTKKFRILKNLYLLSGIFVCFVALVWWHWLAISHYGKGFIFGYFTKHLFVRTTQSIEGHTGGIFTYFKVLPNRGRPWGAFLFLALPFVAWSMIKKKEKGHVLPLIWAVTIFVVASLIKTKLHWYIMPIYPASAMLVGWAFGKLFKKFTVPVTFLLVISVLIYLSAARGIFNLDYTPETKKIAKTAKGAAKGEKPLLYNVGDPAMQFYCLQDCENLPDAISPEELFKIKKKYIILEKEIFNGSKQFAKSNISIIAQSQNFVLIYNRE